MLFDQKTSNFKTEENIQLKQQSVEFLKFSPVNKILFSKFWNDILDAL